MIQFDDYIKAEKYLIKEILHNPDFITSTTYEKIGTGFILTNPHLNKNDRSNYGYAIEFFNWLMTGEKELSKELLDINPWVKRFVEHTGLPDGFSASYGWKIKEELPSIIEELEINRESRRAYVNINRHEDKVILRANTHHEFPCTIGFQFFIRENKLVMIVNMRSNNVYSVMPYDVYNFTMLQISIASLLNIQPGYYYHQINNAHIFKGDVRRIREQSK